VEKFLEEVEEFNIYKSESPNPDYTDFYKTTDENPFYDTMVEEGKVYYYRVAAVDEAGNIGDLSREVYATPLLENVSSEEGLSLELRGYVDNFITEIDSVINDINDIKSSIPSKSDDEKTLFADLKLEKEINDEKSKLNSLKRDVEKYKEQDLTKEELNKKLDSSRLRLNIIKKKIPESLVILEKDVAKEEINEDKINEAILELNIELSEKGKRRSVENTLKLIEESNLKIDSYYYITEIVYLDGTKKEISIVKRVISGELDNKKNTSFVEIIPKSVASSVSDMKVMNFNYNIIREDPVLSFNSDVKEIFYYVNNELDTDTLKETKLVLVQIFEEQESKLGITGYFFMDIERIEYIGIGAGVFIVLLLLIYFFYLKKRKRSRIYLEMYEKIKEARENLEQNKIKEAREIYNFLKDNYLNLNKKDKVRIYREIEDLQNKINLFILKENLDILKERKDSALFLKLKKIYDTLPKKLKKEIPDFEKIKDVFENEI